MIRTAIVSGGSGGIGAAICRALADEGFHVLVGYGGNEAAATAVAANCASATPVHLDVRDEDSVTSAVGRATDIGDLAVVVNNAGVTNDDLLMRLDADRFDATIDVNLRGAYLLSRAALRPMLRARHGRIVSIASIVALRGNAGQTAYGASKAGLIGFSKSLAREVGRKGITANVVAPGYVPTAMTDALSEAAQQALIDLAPAGRGVTPEEVAHAVRFLASDQAGAITGAVVPVDGGAGI